ncbi:respiratory nitrate reductase 1 subunit alpha [Salmonella enterica subsp. enterica]|uniref:Respiratory nitrate reductase 1 subunit alpha n=1 Tax=Salmonella enterica I TaxID=59201 RepID=A0A379WSN8_SALET|nr:respiratory nitrate reductase 1 subunit alpha [Salmonella enterica subsp. enterica]
MIIVGAGLNHWYHLDMNYRGLINMLVFCVALVRAVAVGRTTSARKNCVRRPAGSRWRLPLTGSVRRVT